MRRRDRNAALAREFGDLTEQLTALQSEARRLRAELRGARHISETYRAQLEQSQREADSLRGPALAREAAHAAMQPKWAP